MRPSLSTTATPPPPLLRSLLFAPGSDSRKVGKVASFGSDAVVLDLEDAVADAAKGQARATVRAALETVEMANRVFVRVNGTRIGPDLQDTDGLIEDTRRSRQLGFQGRPIFERAKQKLQRFEALQAKAGV